MSREENIQEAIRILEEKVAIGSVNADNQDYLIPFAIRDAFTVIGLLKSEPAQTVQEPLRCCSECGAEKISISVEKVDFGQSWDFYAPVWKCEKCNFQWADYIAEELYEKYMPPEPGELYINTDGMRKDARSIREGEGTRIGSMAKMLIDCCDKIDSLQAENKEQDKLIKDITEFNKCPECGVTVLTRCAGCMIKELQATIQRMDTQAEEMDKNYGQMVLERDRLQAENKAHLEQLRRDSETIDKLLASLRLSEQENKKLAGDVEARDRRIKELESAIRKGRSLYERNRTGSMFNVWEQALQPPKENDETVNS